MVTKELQTVTDELLMYDETQLHAGLVFAACKAGMRAYCSADRF